MKKPMLVLLVCGCFSLACTITPAQMVQESAERNAREWAAKMGMSIKGAACSGDDSDNDGYTACTLALGGVNETKKIECGYDKKIGWDSCGYGGPNTGCKEWVLEAPTIINATSSGN